jgi:hypothetical protein
MLPVTMKSIENTRYKKYELTECNYNCSGFRPSGN